MMIAAGCIDPYKPGEVTGNPNYLVVDGFLDASQNICTVKLSRTIPLAGTELTYEHDAIVTVEDENSLSNPLTEGEDGVYTATGLALDQNLTYKIKILTQNGEAYQSELVSVLYTPPIDSITWHETKDGVGIYANAHDPANKTRYYHWKFTETWFYRAEYQSILKIVGDTVALRNQEELKIYQCWSTDISKEILVGSSDKLSEDIISQFRLNTIPFTSSKIKLRYSVLVEQRAIDAKAFDYWQQLKKNTEELGTIFDPLPSTTIGNLRCTSQPGKIVLGYFSASKSEQKRIFIDQRDIDFPAMNIFVTGYEECFSRVLLFGEPFGNLVPIAFESEGMTTIGYRATIPFCIDCRRLGGTTEKPAFWIDIY